MSAASDLEAAASETARTFVIADIAGFTALTESHGDHTAADFAVRLEQIARGAMESDDVLVKCLGDAVLLASSNSKAGLDLAIRIVNATGEEPNFPLLRVGLHHGNAVQRGSDWFGAAVNLTARVAAEASAGEMLITDTITEAAAALELSVRDRGAVGFKNVRDPVRVWEVTSDLQREALPVDPTCHMTVSPHQAEAWLNHEGVRYYFCSEGCLARFVLQASGKSATSIK